MFSGKNRLERESQTIEAMIGLYCRAHHAPLDSMCDDCRELNDYAQVRLLKCPYQQDKPTCAKCPIHCYKPDIREKTRVVMRYAGPRMLWSHPVLAIRHMLDGYKKTPPLPRKKR